MIGLAILAFLSSLFVGCSSFNSDVQSERPLLRNFHIPMLLHNRITCYLLEFSESLIKLFVVLIRNDSFVEVYLKLSFDGLIRKQLLQCPGSAIATLFAHQVIFNRLLRRELTLLFLHL